MTHNTDPRDVERARFEAWWTEADADSGQSYADCYGSPVIAWLAWNAALSEQAQPEQGAQRVEQAQLPRHQFWGAGEPDCPPELKAPN